MIENFVIDLGDVNCPAIDIDQLNQLPVVVRDTTTLYAAHQNKNCFWLAYGGEGGVSMTRNTITAFPEFCNGVVDEVRRIAPGLPEFGPERVILIRTGEKGSYWHRDEMFRHSAINIGIKNANTATTRFALTETPEEYDAHFCETRCRDGRMYLLDTASTHRVASSGLSEYRFLASIGFAESFSKLRDRIGK